MTLTATDTNSHTDDRLRIVHIVDHVRNVGNGLVNVAVDLACAQADAGHRVAVVSAGGDYEPLLVDHGVAHHRFVREDSLPGRARMLPHLHGILRAVRPDVVNAHRPYAVAAGRLVQPLHSFVLISTDHNEFEGKGRIIRLADMVVAVSDGAADALAATGVARDRIRTVQNGPLFGARQSSRDQSRAAPLRRPAIVTVAGLVNRKGIYVLLEAFEVVAQEHPDVNLYFVGDGPEREALQERIRGTAFAERIHVEGFQRQPARYLRPADIFVLASYREPFGLAAVEARAAQAAVVVTDVDGLSEAVDHGDAGLIVRPGDVRALAGAIRSLLSSADELACWQSRAGIGIERFSAERMARDTEAVYREALAARRPRFTRARARRPR